MLIADEVRALKRALSKGCNIDSDASLTIYDYISELESLLSDIQDGKIDPHECGWPELIFGAAQC